MPEQQNIEYKQSWRDEYLKWISGFANAQGGKIYIGIDDKGNITGVADYKKLLEDIPNKSVNHLGLVIDVNLHQERGKHYIEIVVPQSKVPISYQGIFHYRSGSTKQELKGIALQNWLLKKSGKSWEDIPVSDATIDDLDKNSIKSFLAKAIHKDRIPSEAEADDVNVLLKNLGLISEDQLTNAAILLFGKRPASISGTAIFKIGRFGKEDHDLLFQDIVETNLFTMADKVMEILKSKYLIRPISYQGLERMEPLEYPEAALREAILNAIIHKDYSSTFIFLRVYNDRLEIWNPGKLPDELNIEKLKGKHSSYPRNIHIAGVFFKAGYVESWGRGTNKIISACIEAGLPEPVIEEDEGGLRVVFRKDIYNRDYLQKLDLNERQIKAILYAKETGQITNSAYQKLNAIGRSVSASELQDLSDKNLLVKVGSTGRSAKYVLPY
ncbi:MAG: transcriptional regulator [Sphingobacteriaceae bacterium]|nr:MAG: transcriptional regulator [Sphingobacteriaceae bacterium]